jgi:hypothetical protein
MSVGTETHQDEKQKPNLESIRRNLLLIKIFVFTEQ